MLVFCVAWMMVLVVVHDCIHGNDPPTACRGGRAKHRARVAARSRIRAPRRPCLYPGHALFEPVARTLRLRSPACCARPHCTHWQRSGPTATASITTAARSRWVLARTRKLSARSRSTQGLGSPAHRVCALEQRTCAKKGLILKVEASCWTSALRFRDSDSSGNDGEDRTCPGHVRGRAALCST